MGEESSERKENGYIFQVSGKRANNELEKGLTGHQRGVSTHQWKDFIIALTTLLTFEKLST